MMRARNRGGFALVTVLWALVIIGILAVEFHMLARADRRVATNARAAVRARWAARAGLSRTLETMDRALGAGQLAASGENVLGPYETDESGVRIHSVVRDVGARLNINRAGRRELLRLLDALAIPPVESQAIVDAVRRAPLDRVEELRSLPQVSAASYDRIAPHVTVVGNGRVSINSASALVLLTLPEMTPDAASAIVARRRVTPYRNVFEVLASVPQPVQSRMQSRIAELVEAVAFTPHLVEVRIEAGGTEGVQVHSISTVLFSGGVKWSVVRTVERLGAADGGFGW